MDESELIKQVQKIRDDALDVLEFSTALARALIELCDETLHAVPAPGAHRKTRRHLRVLPGLAVAGLLGWRLLRHPVVALTAGAVTLTATAAVLTTLPFVTAIPPRHAPRRPSVSRLAPHRDDRHVTAARPPVIGPRAGLTAPAPSPSSPAPRRPASPSPSSPVLPSPSASPSLTLSPSPSPSQSRNGCVTLLGIRLCI